jgi:TonB family protein
VREAVDRLIAERERLDAGLPGTLLVSIVGHLLVIGSVLVLPLLLPRPPLLQVMDGFAVVMPRGGGGSPNVPPPQAAPAPRPAPVASAPPPPPKVLKPPKEAPQPKALPALDSKRIARHVPEPSVTSREPSQRSGPPSPRSAASTTPGLELAPPGPGVPNGTDTGGDWYLAGVQQKIWMLWNQQIKAGFAQPIGVTFTILPSGAVTDVRVTQPSGAALLDMAAQRAVLNAAPFGPLPKEYGQNPRTIQALFRPTS